MKHYRVWIRLNTYDTTFAVVFAESDYLAKRIAEATYGVGNVLSYTVEE